MCLTRVNQSSSNCQYTRYCSEIKNLREFTTCWCKEWSIVWRCAKRSKFWLILLRNSWRKKPQAWDLLWLNGWETLYTMTRDTKRIQFCQSQWWTTCWLLLIRSAKNKSMMTILETFFNYGKLAENWTSTVVKRQNSKKNIVKRQRSKYLSDKIEKLAHYLCFFVLLSF